MVYLTLGDRYSGVIASQVLDVASYLESHFETRIRVLAFISIRSFFEQRKKFKDRLPNTIVVPMVPGLHRWRLNLWLMGLIIKILGEKEALCRGTIACCLALQLKEKGLLTRVTYDGRGATKAEWEEYEVVSHPRLKKEIAELERKSVVESDWRISVSHALIRYWRSEFSYHLNAHSVIPCTVNQLFLRDLPPAETRRARRASYGFTENDIVLIYAGSSAGWQSFSSVDQWLLKLMQQDPKICVLFLAKLELESLDCFRAYPKRVAKDWLPHEEVPTILAMGDYGILIRENTVTNQVASPTKFAEYLCGGLRILISEAIGDYSRLVQESQLGYIVSYDSDSLPSLSPLSEEEKTKNNQLGRSLFSKDQYHTEYEQVIRPTNNKDTVAEHQH